MSVPTWAWFSVQDVVLNGAPDDATGAEVTVETIEGWWDSPGVRGDAMPIPGQHGSYPSPSVNEPRTITMGGKVVHPDPVVRGQWQDRLASLLADGSYGEFTGTDHGRAVRSCLVRLADGTKVDASKKWLEYSIALIADDPRKYGPQLSQAAGLPEPPGPGDGLQYDGSGGLIVPLVYIESAGTAGHSISLSNVGTAEQWPYLQITGPVTNPVVRFSSGDEIRFGPPATTGGFVIPGGGWVDIDCYRRVAVANGNADADRSYAITAVGSWGQIPPGGVEVTWTADDYDPDAKLIAYWAAAAYR